ncbi:TolC family protein [bacterium]|nr:TolC family protein [bacterium]MBU1958001.1 TolC family protein [bacterium]
MKKHLILSSLLLSVLGAESELSNLLSNDKNQLLEQQQEQSAVQSTQLENSWINPVILQYSKNYTTQFGDAIDTKQFVVSVDQPIFKMGGIWSAIQYAKALGKANELEIELQKRQLISQALTTLYTLKKSKYQLKKLELMINNDNLDIQIQKESYEEGLSNRTLYDQALLKRNQDNTSKLELELSIIKLENDFSLLSDSSPQSITLPNFGMMDKERYLQEQLEVKRDGLRVEEKKHNKYMILTKYMPELSLTGRYINEDLNPLFAQSGSSLKREYYNYGFKVTLPLSVNSFHDVQSAKIDYLNAKITLDEKKKNIANTYKLTQKRLEIIDQKIALSKEDAQHYASMLVTATDLESVGDRTNLDTEIVSNTLKVREIDQEIYKIDAQLELLGLYVHVADAI